VNNKLNVSTELH